MRFMRVFPLCVLLSGCASLRASEPPAIPALPSTCVPSEQLICTAASEGMFRVVNSKLDVCAAGKESTYAWQTVQFNKPPPPPPTAQTPAPAASAPPTPAPAAPGVAK